MIVLYISMAQKDRFYSPQVAHVCLISMMINKLSIIYNVTIYEYNNDIVTFIIINNNDTYQCIIMRRLVWSVCVCGASATDTFVVARGIVVRVVCFVLFSLNYFVPGLSWQKR